MLFHLRDAFRAGDLWLARSRRYGDIQKALLSTPVVAAADRSPPAPASPHDWPAERRFALDEGLRRLAAAARAGAIAGGSIEDSVLRVERTETAMPTRPDRPCDAVQIVGVAPGLRHDLLPGRTGTARLRRVRTTVPRRHDAAGDDGRGVAPG